MYLRFTKRCVSNEEISHLACENEIVSINDLEVASSDFTKYGLPYESTVKVEVLDSGIDIVTFSGDKLLGGTNSRNNSCKKEYIDKMKNQLTVLYVSTRWR